MVTTAPDDNSAVWHKEAGTPSAMATASRRARSTDWSHWFPYRARTIGCARQMTTKQKDHPNAVTYDVALRKGATKPPCSRDFLANQGKHTAPTASTKSL